MQKQGLLIVVSGPSGAGKGTICKRLLEKNPEIKISVSATTRLPRKGEADGVNYQFLDKRKFQEMLEKEEFLEYAQVYDNYYGTPKEYVFENLEKGYDVLLEIDIAGALQIKEEFSQGVFVFILPPSLEELKSRIISRGTESKEDIEKRFGCALSEIQQVIKYDYAVINDNIERAIEDVEAIIRAERCQVNRVYEQLKSRF
ncbi:Guanylate kinase [Alkaliphilus metalliredigens QYMF]|uniref:Guanylate kinase n=1 Tax=Alkaliphilus metalliredigens (strain QYMF) TaxID=293826 RepID=A6TRX2_ALKMQ|nr:guanylate kinase [Alkaliphilus metalliredigens]ABR48940.1 Guanylate kinase [Alkaliphilus metalliredigens QYMF]